MKSTSQILTVTLRTAIAATGFCFLASFAHAAGPTVSTPNIFSLATASANSGLTEYGVGDPASVNDGTTSQFFFNGPSDFGGPGSEYLSLTGFDATAGIDSIVFFGNTFSNRTSPSVTIYTSSSDEAGSGALNPSNYTELGSYDLPTSDTESVYSDGTDSVTGRSYDVLSGLGIAAGTESILFSFGGSVYGEGNGFTEIQGFPTSNVSPIPEPGTCTMLLAGAAILAGILRLRNTSRTSLK